MKLRRSAAALLAAPALLLGSVGFATPAAAGEKVVTITAEGVTPKVLQVASGDTVRFVNEDTAFGYRAVATSKNWDLDSGPVGLLPGRSYTHPDPVTRAGTYTYRVAEGAAFEGSVVLPASAGPGPTGGAKPASSPSGGAAGGPGSPSPSPAATGGNGTAPAPPISGGFGSLGIPTDPSSGGLAPPPAIALPDLPAEAAGPAPEMAPDLEPGVAVATGRLASPPTVRGYGLPAALAAVLAGGTASLLVRLLLAEPAARRRAPLAMAGPAPVATA
ncbi:MAG: hypothetical protein WD794_06715 [Mycobacteriales bacterium]